jgi:mycothiol synthase
MAILFRPFRDPEDYELFSEFWSAVNTDWPMSAEEIRREETHRSPEFLAERFIGEVDGQAVCGYVYEDQFWAHRPGRKHISFYVRPDFEIEALRTVLKEGERHRASDGCDEINAWTRSDRPETARVFESCGYRLLEQAPVTRLDLTGFDPAPYRPIIDRLQSEGLRFVRYDELDREGWDWIPSHYEATNEMVADFPTEQTPTPPGLEVFRQWLAEPERYDKTRMYGLLEGNEVVGYTRLSASKTDPTLLITRMTGVRRAYRRRGIGTALKAHALDQEKLRGGRLVQTDNLEENPMLALNLRLGFEPKFSWMHFVNRV